MTWVQAALESRAEGTASSVAHTWGGSAVSWQKSCEDQDCLWPGVVVVEPLGLCGHLSCLLGKLEYPWGSQQYHGLRTVFDSTFLSSATLGLVMGA